MELFEALLPVVKLPQTFSSGKTVNGVTQNHVKAMITAACFELSRPSIGQEIVLRTHVVLSL